MFCLLGFQDNEIVLRSNFFSGPYFCENVNLLIDYFLATESILTNNATHFAKLVLKSKQLSELKNCFYMFHYNLPPPKYYVLRLRLTSLD